MPRRLPNLRSRLSKVLLLAAIGLIGGTGIAQATTGMPDGRPLGASCEKGEFCAWTGDLYNGQIARLDLRTANPEECIPLPDDVDGHSFINQTDRLITVYQGRDCSTEGDFTTYPGGGTFVPEAPFVVRAVQIWN